MIVHDGDKEKSYTVKGPMELTLRDWKDLTPIEVGPKKHRDEMEAAHEMLKRHTGIPKAQFRRLPVSECDKLVQAIADTLTEAMTWHKGNAKAKENKEARDPGKTLEFAGKTYTIPHDIELETVGGQWFDLAAVEEEHEADQMVSTLAILLIEKGKEYESTEHTREGFYDFPLHKAFELDAFFFGRSQRYRNAINLLSRRSVTSIAHRVERALRRSTPATDPSQPSVSLPA